jgi:hypothetical protein
MKLPIHVRYWTLILVRSDSEPDFEAADIDWDDLYYEDDSDAAHQWLGKLRVDHVETAA